MTTFVLSTRLVRYIRTKVERKKMCRGYKNETTMYYYLFYFFLLKQLLLLQQQHQQYWPSLLQHSPCGCEYILLLDMYYYFVLEYQLSVLFTFLCSLNCISFCIEDCHCACVRFEACPLTMLWQWVFVIYCFLI